MSSEKYQYLPEVHEEVDPWHAHAPEEGQPQEEHAAKPNTVVLWGALAATVAFLVVVVLVIYLYFGAYANRLRMERVENTVLSAQARQQRLAAAEALRDYSLLPAAAAAEPVITIPKEEAIRRVLARYGSGN
jgi:hypothetical protein